MRYDGSQQIKDLDDRPLEEEGKMFTLKSVILRTLTTGAPGDGEGQGKFRAYQLAMRIHNEKTSVVNMAVDEVSLVKERVGRIWVNPIMVGRIWEMLEKPMPESEAKK